MPKPSPRPRSYSDSKDNLNAQDRACLEEIERGSQVTLEDQELFDLLSKKKLDGGGGATGVATDGASVANGGVLATTIAGSSSGTIVVKNGLVSSHNGGDVYERSLLTQSVTRNLNDLKNGLTSGVEGTKQLQLQQGSSALKQLLLSNANKKDSKKQIKIIPVSKVGQTAVNMKTEPRLSTVIPPRLVQNPANNVAANIPHVQKSIIKTAATGDRKIAILNKNYKAAQEVKSNNDTQSKQGDSKTVMTIKRSPNDEENKTLNLVLSPGVTFKDGMFPYIRFSYALI